MKAFGFFSFLFASLTVASAQAKPAKCLLLVDGKTYINGACNFDAANDGTGSFSIGTDDAANKHFAYVNIWKGQGVGYWNGSVPETHAHEDLGTLNHNGACWYNDRAIVCAWAK